MHAKSLQSCPTLCDPMDCSPSDSSVHGILPARILEWVARPPPGDLSNSGIKPASPVGPALQVESLPAEPPGMCIHTHTGDSGGRPWRCGWDKYKYPLALLAFPKEQVMCYIPKGDENMGQNLPHFLKISLPELEGWCVSLCLWVTH